MMRFEIIYFEKTFFGKILSGQFCLSIACSNPFKFSFSHLFQNRILFVTFLATNFVALPFRGNGTVSLCRKLGLHCSCVYVDRNEGARGVFYEPRWICKLQICNFEPKFLHQLGKFSKLQPIRRK